MSKINKALQNLNANNHMSEDSDDSNTKLQISNKANKIDDILNSNGLSLGAIGLFVYLSKIYRTDVFMSNQALELSFKKKFTKQDIEKYLNELIDHNDINIIS